MFVTNVKKPAKNGTARSVSEITKSNAGRIGERDKVMRALENEESASTLIDGVQQHINIT